MIHDFAPVARQIAQIDSCGVAFLSRHDRRVAALRAFAQALPVLSIPSLLGFAAGWWIRVDIAALAIGAVVLCALAFAGVYGLARHRAAPVGNAGLALYDLRLRLKDRLRSADEFLRQGTTDGFRGAALVEATPWIAQARRTRLPQQPAGTAMAGRNTTWLVLAAALIAATAVQQHLYSPSADTVAGRALASATRLVPGLDLVLRPPDIAPDGGATHVGQATSASALSGHPTGSGASLANDRGGGQGLATSARSGTDAAAGRSFAGGDGSAGGGGASPRSGDAGRDTMSARPARGAPATQSDAGQSAGGEARLGASQGSAADSTAARQSGTAMPAASNGYSPSSATSSASGQASAAMTPANGRRPGQQNRGQPGGQSQSQDTGEGKHSGRQDQRPGVDALKSAHGALSLMLAVPMKDRLGGMASPGLTTSVMRQAVPQTDAAGPVDAQGRGVGSGTSGRSGHRPMTAQERRLVRDYFRPGGNDH